MKASRILALAAVCTTLATGCDPVRAALGKPTSKDIAALRAQREQMQHTGDSLAFEIGVEEPLADSIATEQAADVAPGAGAEPLYSASGGEALQEPLSEAPSQDEDTQEYTPEGLAEGFWVVLGSFKNEDNAQYFYNSLSAAGTPVELVKMKNGFTAVMICHGDSYEESYRKMLDFYKNEKRPEDIWIYNTAKKLHIQ